MDGSRSINVIARMRSDFPAKFGIPRQSGLIEELVSQVVFEPDYRDRQALRGLEDFSHIWIIWGFSEAEQVSGSWSPTVRPPLLGGNRRMGVFATRSPFRPNNLGLSAVRLIKIEDSGEGPVLHVAGADMMDGTPIYDIKPYLPYADSISGASGGFTENLSPAPLDVIIPNELLGKIPTDKLKALKKLLSLDPRPHYHEDGRAYGMEFSGMEIKFTAEGSRLTVTNVIEAENNK